MPTIIRSVHNALTHDITLEIPGYDATKSPVVVPASGTLDLFSVLNDEQLSSVQAQLAALVAAGDLTVSATADSSAVELGGTSVRLGTLTFTNVSADIGTTSATAGTTVFTPSVTGLYLYSFYGIPTTNAGSSFGDGPNLYMAWTDEVGVEKFFTFAGNLDGIHSDGANQVSFPIHAMAGTPIWMYTAAGTYTTARWNFYFTVTQL